MKKIRGFVKKIDWLGQHQTGYGNGYAVLPIGHKYHSIDYYNIDVDVHGGLTFSCLADELDWPEIIESDKGCWIIGFDTAHYGDSLNNWPDENSVMREVQRLIKQIES